MRNINMMAGVGELKGVGEKTEKLFHKMGIRTVGELVSYYPRSYEIFEEPMPVSQLCEGRVCTVCGAVSGKIQVSGSAARQVTALYLKDRTGTVKAIWFRMPFLRNTLGKGGAIILRGRVTRQRDGLVLQHPDIFYPSWKYDEKKDTMQPVYALTAGMTNNAVTKAVRQALELTVGEKGILPEEMVERRGFLPYKEAIRKIHFPQSKADYIKARERFVFEEFLLFILSLRGMKGTQERQRGIVLGTHPLCQELPSRLPYELTAAQTRVWRVIQSDIESGKAMSRLVQGDVGSGKTILAFMALFQAGLNGFQGALMAPTEVLARQHFDKMCAMIKEYGIPLQARLLVGSMTAAQKRQCYEEMADGSAGIIIGTHALIQKKAVFRNLALVVTDEQHRFGVRQRESLAEKGEAPHILVMSATPIPRTLAIILYGDLDISVLDEMPKNRLPIMNCVVDTGYREKAFSFMRKQAAAGRQCYVICPMVEESEALDAENVTDYENMLSAALGSSVKTACLHGKMKQQDKDEIMGAFGRNEIQILVSTTVVEVGIDVPNATVMLIENAERFGLAQLHQLRGRVGRGRHQSYCIFMTSSKSSETKKRLEILNETNDGFKIAGEDLRLRGPGDIFGIRQSGILDFKMADVFQDAALLAKAAEEADYILSSENALELEEYSDLREQIQKKMGDMTLGSTI